MSQINAYNKALSEKANDVDYFADAYLKILGERIDDETAKCAVYAPLWQGRPLRLKTASRV